MKAIRVKTKIFKAEDIIGKKGIDGMKDNEWHYAFIDDGTGVYLSELWGDGKWCYVSEDIVIEDVFKQVLTEDKDMYEGKTWHEYRSDVVKDILFQEEYDKEIEE